MPVDTTSDYFTACLGQTRGWLIVATGKGPHLEEGRYAHEQWSEQAYRWPTHSRKALEAIAAAAPTADVYACPYPMRDKHRVKGSAATRQLVHADVDGKLDPEAVKSLGGFAVSSGTSGHAHVYVRLTYAVTAAQHELLCRGLAEYLHADCKVSDNDVLRVPGTFNHKSTAAGGEPTPVDWLVASDGAWIDPRVLATVLEVDIEHAEREPSSVTAHDWRATAFTPFPLDDYPTVAAALANGSGDRSKDTIRILGACFDAGLTLPQGRWALQQRDDLKARLEEFANRRKPVDDAGNCWSKIVDTDGQIDHPLSSLDSTAHPHTRSSTSAQVPCPPLAQLHSILDAVADEVGSRGLVGEERLAKTLYLVLTSRLLDQQVSAGVKGHSASGKSYTVETVVRLFPPEAYLTFTAMSQHALVYSAEEYAHRTLVVYEVTALREGNEDDLTSYFVRSLLSEGRIEYPVTVRGKDGGFVTKTIVKEGPTNLVFTTTKTQVHAENETRILSLATDDSREQTARVLLQLADERSSSTDLEEWRGLQRWLAGAEHRVVVPYALGLAQRVPPVAVRLRRDFGALLALIRAHAMLHQANRDRDAAGCVIATVEDYEVVRDLVADVIAQGVGATVAATVRETVAAVATLEPDDEEGVTVRAVSDVLHLDRSNVARRLNVAADGGYVRNLEDRRGRPGRWVLSGDPLPDAVDLLPDPVQLRNTCAGTDFSLDQGVCGCAPDSGEESATDTEGVLP
jgi:hypothetical protein